MAIFRGETIDGEPTTQWPAIQREAEKHKHFVIEVRKYDAEREISLRQMAYLHAVVFPAIADAMGSSLWEAEYWCKRMCGEQWELIKKVGKGMWVECSKTKLTSKQCGDWMENIWAKAEKVFGLHIQAPAEDWRRQAGAGACRDDTTPPGQG